MRLLPLILLATSLAACASATPKRGLTDIEVDVPWEARALPEAPRAAEAEPAPSEPPVAKSSPATDEVQAAEKESVARKKSVANKKESHALHTSTYHLTWQGKRIGEAREVFHRSDSGVRVIRREEIRIKRGGVPVHSETEIVIHADSNLRATRVELQARAGAVTRRGHALRADDGRWVIALEGEPVRKAAAAAVPLELVPYLVAQSSATSYKSQVLLAGYGFAITDMELSHDGRQGRAVLKTRWGDIETRLHMAGDGALLRAATGSTGSIRVGASRLKEKFTPPELPGLSSIPVRGKGRFLLIENALRPPPPAVGGQSVSLRKKGWRIQFDKEPASVSRQVAALVREVDALLGDSHDAPGAGADDALALGRGDCTAHSTLLVDLAAERGIEARLVTGFRLDGDRLVRHRWVTMKDGETWIQVDPTFGEAPVSPGQHLALAVHGDSTAQIALVDEAVFRGLAKARARWVGAALARRGR